MTHIEALSNKPGKWPVTAEEIGTSLRNNPQAALMTTQHQQNTMNASNVTPSEGHSVNITREGRQSLVNRSDQNDGNILNSIERKHLEPVTLKTRQASLRIATWNTRSMWQPGKLDNVIQKMEDMRLDILGVGETRWTGSGIIHRESHNMIYAGGENHARGVGIIMGNKMAKSMKGYWTVSDRMILIKLAAKPFDINIIQCYAPTSDCNTEEIEAFYELLEDTMKHTKSDEILIVMGDMNAKVGKGRHHNVVGNWGLVKRNERGDRLIEYAVKNEMSIMNTWFNQPPRKLYTWTSPGDIVRNQIDYIMIKNRFRNCIHKVKTRPGADCNSDHHPVVASMTIRLKKHKHKNEQKREYYDLHSLKNDNIKEEFLINLENNYSALIDEGDHEDMSTEIDKKYERLVKCIAVATSETLPKKENKKKQRWMNEEILQMMKERKKLKRKTGKYQEKDKAIRTACTEAKEKWMNEQCKEIEDLEERKQFRPMHQKIKEFTGRKRRRVAAGLRDKEGNILFEEEQVANRWVEYIQELFSDPQRSAKINIEARESTKIMVNEVRHAIKSLRSNKACGGDGITAEVLKSLNDKGIGIGTELFNLIYDHGYIPESMAESIFIQLPKKPATMKCEEHRTISLMIHLTKLLLQIIMNRLKGILENDISEEQFGFMKEKGTRDAIFNFRVLCERAIDVQRKVYVIFLDYEKAFDRVNHNKLMECLRRCGVDGKECNIIQNLYWDQKAKVRVGDSQSEKIDIKRGVRQGCIMSPRLFNRYTEDIFRDANKEEGIRVNGRNVNNLRYADDTALLANSMETLNSLLKTVNENGEILGMRIYTKKTKVMIIGKDTRDDDETNIMVNGNTLEKVDNMIYLGQLYTSDGKCAKEIIRRIQIARSTFAKMKSFVTNRNINITTKLRAIRCYVISTLLYGAETWTLSTEMEKRIESLELWLYRRILRISWMKKMTNIKVKEMIREIGGQELEIIREIKKRKDGLLWSYYTRRRFAEPHSVG